MAIWRSFIKGPISPWVWRCFGRRSAISPWSWSSCKTCHSSTAESTNSSQDSPQRWSLFKFSFQSQGQSPRSWSPMEASVCVYRSQGLTQSIEGKSLSLTNHRWKTHLKYIMLKSSALSMAFGMWSLTKKVQSWPASTLPSEDITGWDYDLDYPQLQKNSKEDNTKF